MLFAAATESTSTTVSTASIGNLPEHPGEEPLKKEYDDWFRTVDTMLDRTEYGFLLPALGARGIYCNSSSIAQQSCVHPS